MKQVTEADTADPTWKSLYQIGGVAALLMVAITLTQFVVFAIAPPPLEGTALDWFALFQKSAVLGLLSFEALLSVYAGLSVLVSLALFVVLRRTNPSLTVIFLVLSIMGSIAFISARPALEMLALSNQYAEATADAQRTAFLAAGEAMVATFHGTAFQISYILGSVTGFILGAVMLRQGSFGKAIPYLRMASSLLDFAIFIPILGLYLSLFSVMFLLLFNILISRKLFQFGFGFLPGGT